MKNATGILIGATLNLWITFSSTDILTKLILLIQEHVLSLDLFVSSIFLTDALHSFQRRGLSLLS